MDRIIFKKININEETNRWNEYILEDKGNEIHYSIAHNPSLANIFKESLGYQPEYYLIVEGDKIVGLLPGFRIEEKFISIPIFSTAGIFTHELLKLQKWYSNLKELFANYEIRSNVKFGKYVYDKKICTTVNLKSNIDDQFNSFNSDQRYIIRKAYKSGVNVIQGGGELLNDFYSIYATNVHRLGSPVLSKLFFKELINCYKYGLARIFIVKIGKENIGGGFLLTYGKLAEFEWAGIKSEYNSYNPNRVLFWEIMKYCINNSFKVFSLGRSTIGGTVLQFKRIFLGGEEVPIFFNYSNYTFDIRRLKILSFLWRKIPINIANKYGPTFRKLTKI